MSILAPIINIFSAQTVEPGSEYTSKAQRIHGWNAAQIQIAITNTGGINELVMQESNDNSNWSIGVKVQDEFTGPGAKFCAIVRPSGELIRLRVKGGFESAVIDVTLRLINQ